MIEGKKILLGITGSIAAYKAATLVRLLKKAKAEVKVIMTPSAKDFITPLTLATLSGNPVFCETFDPENGSWNSHVNLGIWADLYIIAPASANTIAKLANGIADNLLLATYLSCRCKTMVAPAMDLDMYSHVTTQNNLSSLRTYGNLIAEPAFGELASGLEGKGRMEEPENLFQNIHFFFQKQNQLIGKTILVTSGPTYEPIDPVRFIGNYSSGLMGKAIALNLASRGAIVELVTGPTSQLPENPNIRITKVNTAIEMFEASVKIFQQCEGAIMAAAVADFTPASVSGTKLSRQNGNLVIELKPNLDIAAQLGKIKKKNQFLIGFALDSEDKRDQAHSKLKSKNLDLIIFNPLDVPNSGLNQPNNKITIIEKEGNEKAFPTMSKEDVAEIITDRILQILKQ